MLSIENPPPDPPCPCEISQLKSSDDNPSDDNNPQQLDLLKSGPKFSIRDYVSSTRSKDIKTNWPFSQENLQLCLKHGVKDLLPPFQSLDAVRNPSAKRCAVESIFVDKENAGNLNEEPSRQTNHFVSVTSSDAKPDLDSVNINPSGFEEDREFPSTTTGQSCSETNSLPLKKSPCLELADTLPEYTATKPVKKVPPASNKVENIVKPPVKKCRLIVKLSSTADQSSKEDNKSNNFPVSETMASKVCPVCKIFTSSSNTTLNAHIDQCLSGESTIKWTANPKVIKHRIKPRRMRSMVDIYATALHYTLEDLDRRNGTNWASGSSVPAQETEVSAAERKQKSPVSFEESENEGAVYVDANGTKLRILSKFNDPSSPAKVGEHFGTKLRILSKFNDPSSPAKVGEHFGPKRLMKGDKGSKLLLTKKKKKKHAQKHHKLQKFAPDSKKSCSPRHHYIPEINDGQEQNIITKEVCDKKEAFTQRRKAHDQAKYNESGTMGGWVCSKRTGLMEKMNGKDDHQHSAYREKKESGGENKELSLGNSYMKRGCVLRSPKSSRNPPSSPKTNMDISPEPDDEYGKELYMRKRARVSSLESQACYDQSRSLVLSEGNGKQLRKNGSSANGRNKDHPHNKANHISPLSGRRVEIKRALTTNADSCVVNSKQSSGQHAFSSKPKKFSLRKNEVSVSQACVPESKFTLRRKLLALKKPRVHCASDSDEEAMVWRTGTNEQNESVENLSKVKARMEKTCDDRTRVLKIRKDRAKIKISRKEEAMVLKSSKSASEYHEHDDDDKFDSSLGNVLPGGVDGKESAVKEVRLCEEDIVVEPASNMPVEEASAGISKSSDVRCHDVAGRSDVRSSSRQFVELYDKPFQGTEDSRCPVEPILSSGQEIFCTDGGDQNIIGQNVHMRTELDSDDGPGNYYIEVDPIPIPGPPGSFLPSPGRMGSEEYQGNSSLTSSQIQSSEDHHEFADRGSSDSPSATSTISNSDVTKFDSRYLEKLHLVPHSVQGEIRSSVSGATVDAVVDNLTTDPRAAYAGAERLNPVEPKANMMFPEMGPFRFKNDQPCCCSRKEGAVLGAVALNHQESQLLRRQTISSVQQPGSEKQINGDASRKLNNRNLMAEVLSSGDLAGGTQNTTRYPLGQIPNKASANSEVKFLSDSDGEPASPSLQNTTRYRLGQIPNKASANFEVKFLINSDGEPASPSISNPVLRLMGKDLMVVNKDENMLPQLRPPQSPMMKSQGSPLSYTASGVYSGNIPKEEPLSSHSVVSQGPIFTQTRGNTVTQHFDVMLSNGYNNGNYGPQRPTHASPLVLSGRSVPESCSGTLQSLEYMHGCYLPPEQLRAMNRMGRPLTCDMEKAVPTTPVQGWNAGSSDQTTKEIIIIDDAPESEADLATDAMVGVGMIRGSEASAGKSVSVTSGFNPRHADPFYGYQPHTSSPCGGSPLAQSATFHQMPPPVGVSSSPIKWNCVPEGSNFMPKGAFPSSSSPAYHMKSTSYHSHGFS